ncbi:MAG: hypothetical protein MUF54_17170, partial [Polyangiaceae bacterium]|nr:hypothetical protein [Polyangiaceae bacterium]
DGARRADVAFVSVLFSDFCFVVAIAIPLLIRPGTASPRGATRGPGGLWRSIRRHLSPQHDRKTIVLIAWWLDSSQAQKPLIREALRARRGTVQSRRATTSRCHHALARIALFASDASEIRLQHLGKEE